MDKEVERNKQVTREEYDQYWGKHFGKNDSDKDGQLKPEECEPLVLFNHIDADKNGRITLNEYLAIYTTYFEQRDANTDGMLDDGEIWRVK